MFFLGAFSSYSLQSALKSAGFPFLSGLGHPIKLETSYI